MPTKQPPDLPPLAIAVLSILGRGNIYQLLAIAFLLTVYLIVRVMVLLGVSIYRAIWREE